MKILRRMKTQMVINLIFFIFSYSAYASASDQACILLDKSGSMLGFFNADSTNTGKSFLHSYIEKDLHEFLENTLQIKTDLMLFSHGEYVTSELVRKDIREPMNLEHFGQTSKLDAALNEAMNQGYRLILLISDNVQDDIKNQQAIMGDMRKLYRQFERENVSQIHVVPLSYEFDGKVYLPKYQFGGVTYNELEKLLSSSQLLITKIDMRDTYIHVSCQGRRGLMMYVVSMDSAMDHIARRLAEKAANTAGSSAIKTFPLGTMKLDIEMAGTSDFKENKAIRSNDGFHILNGRVELIPDGDDSDTQSDYESIFYVKFMNSFDHLKLNAKNPAGQEAAIEVWPLNHWNTIGFENFEVTPSIHPPTLVGEIVGPGGKTEKVYQIKVRIPSDQLKLRLWPITEFLRVVFSDKGKVSGSLHIDLSLPAHCVQLSDEITARYFTHELTRIDKILNTEDLVQFLTDERSVIGTDIHFNDIMIDYPMTPTIVFIIIIILFIALMFFIIRFFLGGEIDLTAQIMKNNDPGTKMIYSFVLRRIKRKKHLEGIFTIAYLNEKEVRVITEENVKVVGGIDLNLPVNFRENAEVDFRLMKNDKTVYNVELSAQSFTDKKDIGALSGSNRSTISMDKDIFEEDINNLDDDSLA